MRPTKRERERLSDMLRSAESAVKKTGNYGLIDGTLVDLSTKGWPHQEGNVALIETKENRERRIAASAAERDPFTARLLRKHDVWNANAHGLNGTVTYQNQVAWTTTKVPHTGQRNLFQFWAEPAVVRPQFLAQSIIAHANVSDSTMVAADGSDDRPQDLAGQHEKAVEAEPGVELKQR